MPVVHSILPAAHGLAVADILDAAAIAHVPHGDGYPFVSAEAAAGDPDAVAVIGPLGSRDVADAVEATAPVGLPMIAPCATWSGVTRRDEPGCELDPAVGEGTLLRIPARDTVVAARLAEWLGELGRRAWVAASTGEYGRQLDAQLGLAGLDRAERPDVADVLIVVGTTLEPGLETVASLASEVPVFVFDGAQGVNLGARRDVSMVLPTAPEDGFSAAEALVGVAHACRAATLVADAIRGGATNRSALLAAVREVGPFDGHGDPVDPPVWLWRVGASWALEPLRAI